MAIPILQSSFFDVGGGEVGKYGNVIGQQLQQLGQQVGQQLAMREYQKQAAAALPALQQSYQSALGKIQAGNVSDAYVDLIGTQMQFGGTTNPIIQSALANFNDLTLKAGEMKKSELFRQAQYGQGIRSAIAGGIPAMSGAEEAQQRLGIGGQPQPMMQEGGQPEGMPEAILLPSEQPLQGTPAQQAMQAEGDMIDRQAAVQLPTQQGMPAAQMQPDPIQVDARAAASQAMSATPAQQNRAITGAAITPKDKDINWQETEITNLSRFFPKTNISDKIGIAPVGSKVDYSETWSGETGKAGARFSGNKKVEVDDALNKKANEYASALQQSVNLLTETGPTGQDKTWVEVIEEGGGIQNFIPQRSEDGFSIRQKGKQSLDADENVFSAFERIKGLSAFASRTGIKLMQEGGEATAELRSRRFGSAEEALASGLPVGTTVYILKDGKYKAAKIRE